ncbi:hemerythrin domain-containing protein [Endothiovibrio diazotrophicus]
MVPFDELNVQNHKIAETSKVLSTLILDRELCDTEIACELFDRYSDGVSAHMEFNEKYVYSILLNHPDRSTNATANKFLEGGKEIKKIFRGYIKKWCNKGLMVADHQRFIDETNEMFDLVWERIQAESEELYPLVRKIESGQPMAKSA